MKKTLSALLVAGSAMAIATPAFAQDNAAFTGPRVEVLAGYDQTRAGDEIDNDAPNNSDDESIEGVAYGVGVGYDFATGGAVIGVEAEYSDSTAKFDQSAADPELFSIGEVDSGRDLYIGARIGALVTPDTLLYVKGGYTNARYNVLASDGSTELDGNIDADGYRIGAGAEYAIGTNSFVKLEYRYSNYSEANYDFGSADIPDSPSYNVDLDRHQVMAGVGFRF